MPPHAGAPSAVCETLQHPASTGPERLPPLKLRAAQPARTQQPGFAPLPSPWGEMAQSPYLSHCQRYEETSRKRRGSRGCALTHRNVINSALCQCRGAPARVSPRTLVSSGSSGAQRSCQQGLYQAADSSADLLIFCSPHTPGCPVRCRRTESAFHSQRGQETSAGAQQSLKLGWFSLGPVSHIRSVAFFTAPYNSPGARGTCCFKRKQLLKNTKRVTNFTVPHPLPFLSQLCWR